MSAPEQPPAPPRRWSAALDVRVGSVPLGAHAALPIALQSGWTLPAGRAVSDGPLRGAVLTAAQHDRVDGAILPDKERTWSATSAS